MERVHKEEDYIGLTCERTSQRTGDVQSLLKGRGSFTVVVVNNL